MPVITEPAVFRLKLPSLIRTLARTHVGPIRQVLRHELTEDVAGNEEVHVSPRKVERLYVLGSGQRIIVSDRRNCPTHVTADGVLWRKPDGSFQWLSHVLLPDSGPAQAPQDPFDARIAVEEGWRDILRFRAEETDGEGHVIVKGLRPPQIGALHAIGAHWSLDHEAATVVMPTGTGKTEAMLAALVALVRGPLLVIVPSDPLRHQTVRKFESLGLLRELGVIPEEAPNPIVGIIDRRPRNEDDLEIFDRCNVVVSTLSALGQGTAAELGPRIAAKVTTLIVDEAHHVAAATWTAFREHFSNKRVLQFTATPYRRDGQLVDGKVIYSYPLHRAQEDGYFRSIEFRPVYEFDEASADRAIAEAAIGQLKEDLSGGFEHVIMARCGTIARAQGVHAIYATLAPEYEPVLVHSEGESSAGLVDRLRRGDSRIVVCVNMLGEGFDLPQLKIAAIHDTHKSLAVLLQFTGRFTRSAGADIGTATVIANVMNEEVSTALERLYSEDADWNKLLSEFSSAAVREHAELVDFLKESVRLGEEQDVEEIPISHTLLRPKFSAGVFRCRSFRPRRFHEALGRNVHVHAAWLHDGTNTLYFVTRTEPPVAWTRSKQLRDRQWDLFVLHYDAARQLLYLHSSDKSTMHDKLAAAVGDGEAQLIWGDDVFRVLARITRLVFQQVGVRKIGRRNLRYAKYTGADVKQALTVAQTTGSVKSDLSGTGFEGGGPVSIGCSYKGRIWSREQDTIRNFVGWCEGVGVKLLDDSISTDDIIENVLIPDEVADLPEGTVLAIEWPVELLRQSEERIALSTPRSEEPLSLFELNYVDQDATRKMIRFRVASENQEGIYALTVGGDRGYEVAHESGAQFRIKAGRIHTGLADYFSDYPPLVRYCDLSELDGNLFIRPERQREFTLPDERFEAWDWTGVDITQESMWRAGAARANSIQGHVAQNYVAGGFDVVFDDDAKGEAADLVCIKEEDDFIRLALVHCKFSGASDAGERVKDVVEVCSQAVRSAKWKWRFRELCRHISTRETRRRTAVRASRFLGGNPRALSRILQAHRFKEVRAEILIVQPGLSEANITNEQKVVLAAADGYLLDTIGIGLSVVCSN